MRKNANETKYTENTKRKPVKINANTTENSNSGGESSISNNTNCDVRWAPSNFTDDLIAIDYLHNWFRKIEIHHVTFTSQFYLSMEKLETKSCCFFDFELLPELDSQIIAFYAGTSWSSKKFRLWKSTFSFQLPKAFCHHGYGTLLIAWQNDVSLFKSGMFFFSFHWIDMIRFSNLYI